MFHLHGLHSEFSHLFLFLCPNPGRPVPPAVHGQYIPSRRRHRFVARRCSVPPAGGRQFAVAVNAVDTARVSAITRHFITSCGHGTFLLQAVFNLSGAQQAKRQGLGLGMGPNDVKWGGSVKKKIHKRTNKTKQKTHK